MVADVQQTVSGRDVFWHFDLLADGGHKKIADDETSPSATDSCAVVNQVKPLYDGLPVQRPYIKQLPVSLDTVDTAIHPSPSVQRLLTIERPQDPQLSVGFTA